MASEDSRYKFSFNVKLEEEGKAEPPMMVSELVYNGLPYSHVIQLEKLLGDLVKQLNAIGEQQLQALGSGKKP
jgi:hypothetical protein